MKSKGVFIIVFIVAALFFFAGAYVVDETEQAVVTRFGRVVGEPKQEPGLNFRIPVFYEVNYPTF